jgi:hypothetical protein
MAMHKKVIRYSFVCCVFADFLIVQVTIQVKHKEKRAKMTEDGVASQDDDNDEVDGDNNGNKNYNNNVQFHVKTTQTN